MWIPRASDYTRAVSEQGQVKTDELDAQAEARRRLALAQIRQYPDPVLRLEAQQVDSFDQDLQQLVERMVRLMQDARGVGLAANQVGILRRVFVFLQWCGARRRAVVLEQHIVTNGIHESSEAARLADAFSSAKSGKDTHKDFLLQLVHDFG